MSASTIEGGERTERVDSERFGGLVPAALLLLGPWFTWATEVIGVGTVRRSVDGREVATILDLPVGWIVSGAGIVAVFGLLRSKPMAVIAASLVSLLVIGYALATIREKEVLTWPFEFGPFGELDLGDEIKVTIHEVKYAPGILILGAASIALLVIGVRMRRGAASVRLIEL